MSLHDAKRQLDENIDLLTHVSPKSKEDILFYNLSAALLQVVQAIEEIDDNVGDLKSKQATISSRLAFLVDEAGKK